MTPSTDIKLREKIKMPNTMPTMPKMIADLAKELSRPSWERDLDIPANTKAKMPKNMLATPPQQERSIEATAQAKARTLKVSFFFSKGWP